ncbi:acetyltransferase [Streptococcus mutans SF14]|nr:acetyltransferase [Streptococcus mutans SF14]
MAGYYQSIPRVVYFVLKDYSQIVGTGGFAPVFLAVAEL